MYPYLICKKKERKSIGKFISPKIRETRFFCEKYMLFSSLIFIFNNSLTILTSHMDMDRVWYGEAQQYRQTLDEYELPEYPHWHKIDSDSAALVDDGGLPSDYTVLLNNNKYLCHKGVLGYGKHSSKFFHKSFANDMTNETNLSQLIPVTCHSVWETALNFMYDPTKPLTDQTVNESTIVPLYKVAHVFENKRRWIMESQLFRR